MTRTRSLPVRSGEVRLLPIVPPPAHLAKEIKLVQIARAQYLSGLPLSLSLPPLSLLPPSQPPLPLTLTLLLTNPRTLFPSSYSFRTCLRFLVVSVSPPAIVPPRKRSSTCLFFVLSCPFSFRASSYSGLQRRWHSPKISRTALLVLQYCKITCWQLENQSFFFGSSVPSTF